MLLTVTSLIDLDRSDEQLTRRATAYGVLNQRGMANRWTFSIGKDGRILAVDKAVRPETSAEDMAAKLKEFGIATNSD